MTTQMKDRSEAIGRAQRALKALGEHPRSSKKELGHAREHLNACYSHGSGENVWNAVAQVEAMAERRYRVPSTASRSTQPATSEGACDSRPGPRGRGPCRRAPDIGTRCGTRSHRVAMRSKAAFGARIALRMPLRGRKPGLMGTAPRPRCVRAILSELDAAARCAWVFGYLVLVITGVSLTVTAVVAAPRLAGPAMMATMSAAVAFLGLRVTFDRREEVAADLFAVDLMRDLDAAAELMQFYEDNVVRPMPDGVFGRAWARLERRWFATHPEPRPRLAAMRRHLVDQAAD